MKVRAPSLMEVSTLAESGKVRGLPCKNAPCAPAGLFSGPFKLNLAS